MIERRTGRGEPVRRPRPPRRQARRYVPLYDGHGSSSRTCTLWLTFVLFVRQLLDTLELALAGAERARVEVDGSVHEARRSGRPRRGGAKRRVRDPGLMEQLLG